MGVVEVDPAELARYRAKQKQTHNRYIQKRQAMMKKGSRENTHLKPGTPTWIGDADWDAVMQKNLPFVQVAASSSPFRRAGFCRQGRGSTSSHDRSRCIIGRGPCGLCRTHCPPTGSNHPVRSRAQSAAAIVDFERCPKHVAKHHRLDQEGCDACCNHHHGHALDANLPSGIFTVGRTRPARPPTSTRNRGTCHGHGEGGAASAREAPLSVAFGLRYQLQARHDLTLRANTQRQWGR